MENIRSALIYIHKRLNDKNLILIKNNNDIEKINKELKEIKLIIIIGFITIIIILLSR